MSQKQPQCPDFNDSGFIQPGGKHEYCTCAIGALLHIDAGDNAKRWLERMDASIGKKPAREPRRVNRLSLAELEAEYYASQQQKTKEDEPHNDV